MELSEHGYDEPPVEDCDCRRCAIATRNALRHEVARLRGLLSEAAQLFRFYEQSHRQRGPEHAQKADRNAEVARRIEATLMPNAGVNGAERSGVGP